jgi:acetylornithine deacetylase
LSFLTSPSAILRELVAIASPSALSNLPLLRFVTARLEALGWRVELFPYSDEHGVAKANLVARPGGFRDWNRMELAFICHTDTVPFAAEWQGALTLVERDGYLHGCGACDVKGALACFLAAMEGMPADGIDPGVGLILTADEEIGCEGMERLLATSAFRIGSAIVSEPTSLRAGTAGKGYGLARITVLGREAHSAFPQQGVSAISAAVRLIVAIEDDAKSETHEEFSYLFDPPRTTLNIGVIEGGTAKNIVPGRCSFLVEWRPVPGERPEGVAERLRNCVEAALAREPRAKIELEVLRAEAGFAPSGAGRLRERLAGWMTGPEAGISFGSEASRVARISEEVIVIGPGDMRTAHSDRECVPVAELERWTEILREILRG